MHYNITLILHDKPLIFYKRPRPIWGEAGRNLPERVAIRGEKKKVSNHPTKVRYIILSYLYPSSISVPQFSIPFFHPYVSFIVLHHFFPHLCRTPLLSLLLYPVSVPSITRHRHGTLTAISRNVILLKHMSAWLIGRSTVRINNSARSPRLDPTSTFLSPGIVYSARLWELEEKKSHMGTGVERVAACW